MSKLAEYNKLVHPELNGACAVCGINPADIKLLFQELIDEVIGHDLEYRETEDMSLITWSADGMKAFGRNELKIYQRQRAKELMEKL